MGTFFDTDGNEVEAYTTEEVNEQIESAREAGKEELAEEMEELKGQIAEKDNKIKELEELMEGGDDKSRNFANLRKAKEKAERERDEANQKLLNLGQEIDTKIKGVKEEIAQSRINEEIKKRAGGDIELEKKIKFYYNQFKPDEEKDPNKKEENFINRLNAAELLATGGKAISPLENVAGTRGGYVPPATKPGEKISEDIKQMAKEKMGLTDDDFKIAGL